MKKVLSLLMIFVFLNVSSWAFAPVYPTTSTNVSGTYAGVLIPNAETTTTTSASLGVFAIGIPASTSGTSIATGAGVVFSNGAGYNTLITGVFDPQSSKLQAVLEGTSNFQIIVNIAGTPTPTNIFAQGNMTATLAPASVSRTLGNTGTGAGTANAERLTGTASLDLFRSFGATGPIITSTVTFNVSGFQQSATFSTPSLQLQIVGS